MDTEPKTSSIAAPVGTFLKSKMLGPRLLRSHMTVAAIGLAMLGLVLLFSLFMRARTANLAQVNAPMAQASRYALQGVERSLADLRGWVVLNDTAFTERRRLAWSRHIDPAMASLEDLSGSQTKSERDSIAVLKRRLSELREVQWWIEDVAQTPGNEPATDLLTNELRPPMEEIYGSITALIDLEKTGVEPNRSNRILASMADFRGSFTRGHAALSNFVQSGAKVGERAFQSQIGVARRRLEDLAGHSASLTPEQRALLNEIEIRFPPYVALAREIIALRQAPDWNHARFLLAEEAVPKSREITAMLTTLANQHSEQVTRDATDIQSLSTAAIGLSAVLMLTMAVSAWFVSRRGASRLTEPIEALSGATRKMAAGELKEDIPILGNGELAELTRSFNQMRSSVADAEQLLKRREEESRTVIDSSPGAMLVTDKNASIVMFNRQAEKLFGYSRDELLGQPIEILVPDSVQGHHDQLRNKYMENPEARSMGIGRDLFARRKDGSEFPVEIGLNPVETGDEMRVIVGIFDVTERKRVEKLLSDQAEDARRREEESRTVIESSPSGMIMTDQGGSIVMLNQQAAALFGYAQDELLGQQIEILVPDSVRGHHHKLRDGYMEKPEVRSMGAGRDLFGQRKDGSQIPIEIGLNPIRTGEGLRVLVGIIDLTERKRAEEEQKVLSNRLVLAAQAGEIGIWDYDVVNNSLVWDDQMYQLYGIAPERFSGAYEAWEEGLHPDDLKGEAEKLQMALRGEAAFDTEFRVIWPDDGSVHFIKANGTVLCDEAGEAVQMIGINWDITERKRNEEILHEAKLAAEAASEAKSDFLANMSHEIRTPMNGIIGMTELLLATEMNKEQRDYLNLVNQSADSLLNVINDILDFSKIEAGKLELDDHEFDLRDSIGDTLQTLGFRAAEKGLELAYQVQSNVPDCLVGDIGRLRQVIVNLVGNALKFTAEGEVLVDVQLESQTRDQVSLHFLVKDTGIGIPADKQKAIFESFTQAESSTTRTFGGTGLGLTISRQLVGLMMGRIWVESQPGEGSVFHFTALLGIGSGDTHESRAAPETLNGLPVLIVDDNDTNRRILEEMLKNWEMCPTAAAGGAEGLEKLDAASKSAKPIELILLDLMMPEMDGPEVARRVSERFGKDAPKICILSSAGHQTSKEHVAGLDIDRVLTKPVKQSDLLDAITRLFGAATRDTDASSATRARPDDVPSMRVLMAEDGRVNQMVAIKLLENRGHSVVVANNGREAVEHFENESEHFDAILMDVQMPELDGYDATRAIRRKEEEDGGNSHIPIIAMTANAMKGDREKCLEVGMDDYVAKPVRSEELFEALERFANAQPTKKAPEPSAAEGPSVFDSDQFRAAHGDASLMRQLIEFFAPDSADLLTQAREALAARDAKALHYAAHSLKGLVGNYYAQRATRLTKDLDEFARGADLRRAGPQLEKCEKEISRLNDSLAAFAKTLKE